MKEVHDIDGAALSQFMGLPSEFVPATGAEIHGSPTLSLDASGTGFIVLDGMSWRLTAFELVDCSDCDVPGWYEVHALLTGVKGETGLVFLYLMPNSPETVSAQYGIRLDRLADLAGAGFSASWSWHTTGNPSGSFLSSNKRPPGWRGLRPRSSSAER